MLGELPSSEGLRDDFEASRQGRTGERTLQPVELRVRELPPDELPRLRGVLSDYRDGVDSKTARVIVAENEAGSIVATWGVFATVHIEPLWIAVPHRKNPGLIRALWDAVYKVLRETGQQVSFAVLSDESPALAPAERLGFDKIDGSLYWVKLRGPRENWRPPSEASDGHI